MTRDDVVAAARELFRRNGFHGTSMRDIAGDLNASPSAVYNYFSSKDDILLAVLEQPITELTTEVSRAMQSTDNPMANFLAAYECHLAFHLYNPVDAGIFSSEFRFLTPANWEIIKRLRNQYEDIFKSLIEQCNSSGSLKLVHDVSVTTNIVLGIPSTTTSWFSQHGPVSPAKMLTYVIDFVLHGIGTEIDCLPSTLQEH